MKVNEHGEVIQDLLRVDRPVNPVPPAASKPADGGMPAVVNFSMTFAAIALSTPRISPKMFLSIHACSMIVGFIRLFRVKNC